MSKKRRPIPKPNFDELMPLLIAIWRKFHKIRGGPSDRLQTREFRGACEAIMALNQGLHETGSLIGQEYFKDRKLLSAYLLYHFTLHYSQGLSLLEELPTPPVRVLDLCSGPGAFALAAMRHGASEVFALDRDPTALQLGAEVCGKSGHTLTIRTWHDSEEIPVDGRFDLITLGHSLKELFPDTRKGWAEAQERFIKKLLNLLTPEGHLLLVESSWPDANNRLLSLRDQLVKENVPIQAPCVWQGQCPALQTANSPCYAQRPFDKPYLIKELQRGSQINLGSLKMSYLMIKSPLSQWPVLPRENLFRVISPPVESIRGKRFYLCGTAGKSALGSRLNMHPSESRSFEFLQRGDLISIDNPLESKGLLEIVEDTQVSVVAACGKPLP